MIAEMASLDESAKLYGNRTRDHIVATCEFNALTTRLPSRINTENILSVFKSNLPLSVRNAYISLLT